MPISKARRMLLPTALIVCSVALMLNYLPTHTTYAVAPTQSAQTQTNDIALAQVKEAAAKKAEKLAVTPSIWPVSGPVTSALRQLTDGSCRVVLPAGTAIWCKSITAMGS